MKTYSRIASQWIAPILVLAALLPLFRYYRTVYPSPDQALFDYLGWMNIQGRIFYAQGFEQNWPGALLLHETATRLFGVHSYSFRTLDFLIMVAATASVAWHFIRRGLPVAGSLFAFAYPIIYATSGRWMAGERDVVAMNLLLIASVLLLRAEPRAMESPESFGQAAIADTTFAPLLAAFGAGALIAFSMLVRPTYVFFAGAAGGMVVARAIAARRSSSVLKMVIAPCAIGFTVLLASVVIAALEAGNLDDWYAQTITFNLDTYQVVDTRWRLGGRFLNHLRVLWPWLAPIAPIGLLSLKDERQKREVRYGIALLSTVFVSFVAQNKGFGYHLGGLIPLFTLAVAMGMESCIHWAKQGGRKLWLAPGLLVGLILVTGLTSRLEKVVGLKATKATDRPDAEGERNAIVSILRCETGPRDLVFQWGRLSDILYRAERLPASRLVSTPALDLLNDGRGRALTKEFALDLQKHKPRMIVTDNEDLPLYKIRSTQAPIGLSEAATTMREDLRANYRVRFAGEHLTLFERRGVARLRQCS